MALSGTFTINGADYCPLFFPGIGTFSAFSGDGKYKNQPGCNYVANVGPLPPGKYWIVSRPVGGLRSKLITLYKNIGTGVRHEDWFALYRDDGKIDDYTWFKGVERGNFRLHPNGRFGISDGCITLVNSSDFYSIRNTLLRTPPVNIPGTSMMAYGTIQVINSEDICKVAR